MYQNVKLLYIIRRIKQILKKNNNNYYYYLKNLENIFIIYTYVLYIYTYFTICIYTIYM